MTTLTIFIYLISALISWVIFYHVVKAAVKNGIREARSDKEVNPFIGNSPPDTPANAAQMTLQQRYDKGEINFKEFKSEWNKLSS